MTFLRRLLYLGYYIKELNIKQFISFVKYSSNVTGISRTSLLTDSINSIFKYNTSLKDYFYFRFFELNKAEREKWAGTGFMYEFQLKINPPKAREVLSDKIKFLNHFKPFVRRGFYDICSLKNDNELINKLLTNKSGKLVLKNSRGQIGSEVEVITCIDYTPFALIKFMKKRGYDLVEEYVVQHSDLMDLSSSGLNTVRVITQLNGNDVDIIGCRLRISVNSPVDNMAAGNIAAAIDTDTGIVKGPGVYSDITKQEQYTHPISGKPITGFVIPFWNEIYSLAKKVALLTPQNRSVGWDISITPSGPELIEGNHNWCKLLWQLPVKQGLKGELKKYL